MLILNNKNTKSEYFRVKKYTVLHRFFIRKASKASKKIVTLAIDKQAVWY